MYTSPIWLKPTEPAGLYVWVLLRIQGDYDFTETTVVGVYATRQAAYEAALADRKAILEILPHCGIPEQYDSMVPTRNEFGSVSEVVIDWNTKWTHRMLRLRVADVADLEIIKDETPEERVNQIKMELRRSMETAAQHPDNADDNPSEKPDGTD